MSLKTFTEHIGLRPILANPEIGQLIMARPDIKTLISRPFKFIEHPEVKTLIGKYGLVPEYSIHINKLKRHVRPFWLLTDSGEAEPTITTVAANATANPVAMPVDTQGHFEAFYCLSQSTGPYTVIIFDPGKRRNLMNREIHIRTLGGNAEQPFIFPESYFMNVEDGQRSLMVTFRNLTNVQNQIRFALVGRRWYNKESSPQVQMEMRMKFAKRERTNVYFLTTDGAISLAGNAAGNFNITMDDLADTEIFKMMSFSDSPFTFEILERASNRTLSNGIIHSDLGFGTENFPFIFPESLLVERNYQLTLRITNLSPDTNNIFVNFAGRRLYYA